MTINSSLRWLSAGESHGAALVGIIDGMPAGVPLTSGDIEAALRRRRGGYGRGARQRFEQDQVRLLGGVRHGLTLGSPIAVEIGNSEWPKWDTVMSPDPVDPASLLIDAGTGDEREVARNRKLTRPRPGHADLAGMMKYDAEDARLILERASARESATRVAVGEAARQLLRAVAGVEVISQVTAVGQVFLEHTRELPQPTQRQYLDDDPMRTLDAADSARFQAEVDRAKATGDTVGGEVEVVAWHVPIGLGSHIQWDRRLDAALAAALMSIPSAKTVSIGDGTAQVRSTGTAAHDEIFPAPGGEDGTSLPITRPTNRAGGIEGGMSNGAPIRASVGLKPISTVPRPRHTIDLLTGESAPALHQRSDTCQVVPAAHIAEAMVCLVLAEALLDMYGNGHVGRIRRALQDHQSQIRMRLARS